MDSNSGATCVKPFNHLTFLVATIVGGGFAFLLVLGLTQSYGWGQGLLIALVLTVFVAMVFNYYWHYRTYTRWREWDMELTWALVVQGFILLCWIIFSADAAIHLLKIPFLHSVTIRPPSIVAH